MQVGLQDDLGVEVADLRAHDGKWVVRGRARPVDEERVRHVVRRGEGGDRLHGAGVDHRGAGSGAGGALEVREPLVDGRRRLGVVSLAQVAPDLEALLRAELRLEAGEQLGSTHLVATAFSEDSPDQRGRGDHVVARPRAGRVTRRPVVGVEAFEVGVEDLTAPVAELGEEADALRVEELLGLRARLELAQRGGEAERVEPRHVERGHPGRTADHFQQQPAVVGRRPARAVHHVGTQGAEDVGHPEGVAHEPKPWPRRGFDRAGLVAEAEDLGLEVLRDVGRPHLVEQRREAVVQRDLVGGVDVGGQPARLAGREHVEQAAVAVAFLFGPRNRAGTQQQCADERDDELSRHGSPSAGAQPYAAGNRMYSSMISSARSGLGGTSPSMRPRARRSPTRRSTTTSSVRSAAWWRQACCSCSSVKQYAFHDTEKRSSSHA